MRVAQLSGRVRRLEPGAIAGRTASQARPQGLTSKCASARLEAGFGGYHLVVARWSYVVQQWLIIANRVVFVSPRRLWYTR